MTLLIGLWAIVNLRPVLAINLRFKFDINSSGPSIYACNAGLRHSSHETRVCYERGNPNKSCTPGNECSGVSNFSSFYDDFLTQEKRDDREEEESGNETSVSTACNCVCTGGANGRNGGEYRNDYMGVSYAIWTDNGDFPSDSQSETFPAGERDFVQVFADNVSWGNQLTHLGFNFGSERYGAEFFLDVCYRGPQIEYYELFQNSGENTLLPDFVMQAQVTVTDLSEGNVTYQDLSKLKVRSEVLCDVQGLGNQIYARNSSNEYDTLVNDIMNMASGDRGTQSGDYTNFYDYDNVTLISPTPIANSQLGQSPRFCKVRYYFIE